MTLTAEHLVKRYGGVVALSDGSLSVSGGEVLALLGANGSGKSTLSKIVTGVASADGGVMRLDGREIRFRSPQEARRAGIGAVYQELSLIPDMTVAANIWLTHEPLGLAGTVSARGVRARAAALIELFAGATGPNLAPEALVAELTPDERQIVEILKAISLEPRLLILDEATSSLDSQQVARLFHLIADWKRQGRATIFVSHRMDEVFHICDRAVVLRGGASVGEARLAETSERALVQLMIGGEVFEIRLHQVHLGQLPGRRRRAVLAQQVKGLLRREPRPHEHAGGGQQER
ncbi:MAG: sugar ABC transporter ATP-binding protein, partial [Chloroflexales bacterium]|nr:sugar ABC transporter ATP-binding protein [Chloroflexales bacterium]